MSLEEVADACHLSSEDRDLLFEATTVAALAREVDTAKSAGLGVEAPPIRPVPGSTSGIELPLSFAQERLWFLDRLQPGTSLYNLPLAFLVRGPLDIPALAGSLGEIVRRHSALRTRFGLADGRPVQSVAPAPDLALPLADLRELPGEAREREARRLAAAEGARPFRLDCDLLLRCLLVRVGEREHAAAVTLHHIAADDWSMGIFLRELGALYRSRLSRLPSPLSEPALQYVDFAVWQRGYLAGERLEAELSHWRAALDGVPAFQIPTDRPRPAVLTSRGGSRRALLPRELGAAALALGRAEGATLFMVLLAALAAVLSRHTGQDDLTVGTPIANRTNRQIEPLIGLFANTLVLRADCTGEPGFRELLARMRRTALEAYAHQELPFAKLVEALQPERSLSHTPLFQVLFALQETGREAPDLPGLTLIPFGEEGGNAEFELSVTAVATPEGIVLALEHNVDLFDGATALRLAGHLRNLLEAAVADPGRRPSELPLLGPAERHQLLREMDPGPAPALVPGSSGRCLHELFEEQAARAPAALALIDLGGDGSGEAARLTYAQLDVQATALARRLRALGARPEGAVGVCLDRSPELAVALLAIWKAGGVYLPLDPAYPGERLELMLRDAGASLMLTRSGLAAGLPAGAARLLLLDGPGALAAPEGLHERGEGIDPAPLPAVSPQNLAYLIYTSGSTGRPKGVAVSHAAAAGHFAATAAAWELGPGDRSVLLASPSFDASLDEIVPALLAGACLAVGGTDLWQPAPLLRAARRFGLTVVNFATAVWNSWMQDARELDIPAGSPLRLVVVGGEAMSPAAARQWWRSPLSAMRLLNTYGPTEAVVTATQLEVGRREAEAAAGAVAIGRPCGGRHAVVLDRRGLPVPAGIPGELCLGGAALARGYLGLPAATAERFVPDPFGWGDALGARLYRTGDLVRRRLDGVLEFLGRIDQQVKIRGFRIEPGEVAAALAAHPALAEAAVEVVEARDGGRRLAAFAVLRADARFAPGPRELRAYLEARLPAFLVPVSFVLLKKLPLTPNDKLDRRALARLAARAVDAGGEDTDRVGPRDDLELRLARIWEELLEVPAVGVHDSFFDLGGHSLLAVRLISRIARELGRELPLAALFQAPTLERLAVLLRADEPAGAGSPLVPLVAPSAESSLPPFFCVHPVGGAVFCYLELARRLGPDQPFYGVEACGLAPREEPGESVEEMAARYLAAVRAVQLSGPYRLGGWSFGGLVAVEMARQLAAAGEETALLALFDPTPLAPRPAAGGPDDLATLALLARDLGGLTGRSIPLPLALASEPDGDRRLDLLLASVRKAGALPPDAGQAQMRRLARLYAAHLRAADRYRPASLDLPCDLFLPERSGPRPGPSWERDAAPGSRTHRVGGDHYGLLRAPHVEDLARRLRERLGVVRPR